MKSANPPAAARPGALDLVSAWVPSKSAIMISMALHSAYNRDCDNRGFNKTVKTLLGRSSATMAEHKLQYPDSRSAGLSDGGGGQMGAALTSTHAQTAVETEDKVGSTKPASAGVASWPSATP